MKINYKKASKNYPYYKILVNNKQVGEIWGNYPMYEDIKWQGYFIIKGWEFDFGCESLSGVKDVMNCEIPEYMAMSRNPEPRKVLDTWKRLHSRLSGI